MKKIFIAPVLALAVLTMGTASAAPAISPSSAESAVANKPSVTKVRQALVYRCWTYNTQRRNWYGQHSHLPTARQLAMSACVANTPGNHVCYHYTGPCQEIYY